MIRNQFVLNTIIVKDANNKTGEINPKNPSVRIGVTNDRKSVEYNIERAGRTLALSFGSLGAVTATLLIIKAATKK